MSAEKLTVQPYFGIHVDAVKLDHDALPLLLVWNGEDLAIPTRAASSKAATYLADSLATERRLGTR